MKLDYYFLNVAYIIIVMPIAAVLTLFRYDKMGLKIKKKQVSYFTKLAPYKYPIKQHTNSVDSSAPDTVYPMW